MPFFCAVPPTLPPSPEGVRAFPGAGPYVVQEYRPDERITIRRNRYYGGDRVHHVDGFDVDLHANSPEEVLDRIEAGRADWGYTLPAARLPPQQGVDRQVRHQQLTVLGHARADPRDLRSQLSAAALQGQPELRRAVNLALDRSQCINQKSVPTATDQYLPTPCGGTRPHDLPAAG